MRPGIGRTFSARNRGRRPVARPNLPDLIGTPCRRSSLRKTLGPDSTAPFSAVSRGGDIAPSRLGCSPRQEQAAEG
jgi:hypothetical protein